MTHPHAGLYRKLLTRRERLRAELANVDGAIATIDAMIGESARNGFPTKLTQAIVAERRNGRRRTRYVSAASHHHTKVDMTALLQQFGDTPVTIADVKRALDLPGRTINAPIGSLLRYGYLKKKGGGYVRTNKRWGQAPADAAV